MNTRPLISRNRREGEYAGKCLGRHRRDRYYRYNLHQALDYQFKC